MKDKQQQHIICAAIHFEDDKEYVHQPKNIQYGLVICGHRHHNVFAVLSGLGINRLKYSKHHIQGFLTNDNIFVDREQAMEIAYKAGQINEKKKYRELYSEDIY